MVRVGDVTLRRLIVIKKKATVQQKEGNCNRDVAQGATPRVSAAAGGSLLHNEQTRENDPY